MHLVEDDLPVVRPEFHERPVQELEGVAGVHDGLPVPLADLGVFLGDVLVGEEPRDYQPLGRVLGGSVLDGMVALARLLLRGEEVLGEHLRPRRAAEAVHEGVVLDHYPLAEPRGAQEHAGLLKAVLYVLGHRALEFLHQGDDPEPVALVAREDRRVFLVCEVSARRLVEHVEDVELLP